MNSTSTHDVSAAPSPSAALDPPFENLLAQLGAASELARHHSTSNRARTSASLENQLAMVRLGMATALFYALRSKHRPTAAHSLRVALGCSLWASRLGLPSEQRDRLEVAALLHDVGKIGIPDAILRKPCDLSVGEQVTMDTYPALGCEILRGCTDDHELLNIVRFCHAWYDSRRAGDAPRREDLPLGARLLAIVGAFDAMTTDHVYRPAMSRERAVAELLEGGGTQFDPELVRDYCRMLETPPEAGWDQVATRWLQELRAEQSDRHWVAPSPLPIGAAAPPAATEASDSFHRQLLANMHDGVLFVDRGGNIIGWNRAMEKLSGISTTAALEHQWMPELIGMTDGSGKLLPREQCPLLSCLGDGVQRSLAFKIRGPHGRLLPVHVHVSPVSGMLPGIRGGLAIFHDASQQTSLEERLVVLHEQATKDPLTGVDNRGQFDRLLVELTELAATGGPTFSLIICDIDRFKQVNDVYGHQAGDEALVSFAKLLQGHSRDNDLVGRYGGEEFVVLTPSCDNPTATRRAEAIRQALEKSPIEALEGKAVTASFGVTEFQEGDTAETVLARADRALLRAKDTGRNQVMQLGAGGGPVQFKQTATRSRVSRWLAWFDGSERTGVTVAKIATPVPADIAIEKLRGFIADHHAEIVSVEDRELLVRLNVLFTSGGRRRLDCRGGFELRLRLDEEPAAANEATMKPTTTLVRVQLCPIRGRDRRRRELGQASRQVLASLKSYLMGTLIP